jgi:hypothetical protein
LSRPQCVVRGEAKCHPVDRPSSADQWPVIGPLRNHRVALSTPIADIVTDCFPVAQKFQCLSYGPTVAVSGSGRPWQISAPGNDAPIGRLKVITRSGWLAARPSGTENVYKIYAESFASEEHLNRILAGAQGIVDGALARAEVSA